MNAAMSDPAATEHTSTAISTATATRTQVTTVQNGLMTEVVVWGLGIWQRVMQFANRCVRWCGDTVSPAGWCVSLAALLALTFGLGWGWQEALVAGIISAVLLLLAVLFLFGATAYRVTTDLTDTRVVAGEPIMGTVHVENSTRRFVLPGRVDVPVGDGVIQMPVPLLRARGRYVAQLQLPTSRRGILQLGPVITVRGDPIGLVRRDTPWSERYQLFIHPRTTSVPSTSRGFIRDLEGTASSVVVDSDISFHAIREYQAGDSQRHINWKSTAKTGTLMVRQFEETRRSRLALVLATNPDEFASDDEFELAISALGSLGTRAVHEGRDVSVVTSHAAPAVSTQTVRSIDELAAATPRILLDALSGVEKTPNTMPLLDVCTLATEVITDISLALVFVGSRLTPLDLKRAALRFPVDTQVVAVIANPEAAPRVGMFGNIRFMTIAVLDDFRHLLARGAQR